MKYYAVKKGLKPGIYHDWDDCKKQVYGFKGAQYKSFKTENEANDYMNETNEIKSKFIKPDFDILVYTDGSSKNKKGGYAYLIVDGIEDSGPIEGRCSNQLAELYAIYHVLCYLKDKNKSILIRTDSQWCIDCFTSWIDGWYKNGFLTSKKEPVKHAELIIKIDKLLKQFTNLKFEHVDAHAGEIYNERVDKLAKQYNL